MEMSRRPHPLTLVLIAAAHAGLLALVLIKPKVPAAGVVTYMELLRVVAPVPKPKPKPVATLAELPKPRARPARAATTVATPDNAAPAAAPADSANPVIVATDSAAPDFAAAPKPLDIDQLRRQAARNDTSFKTPLDKVREEELRRKSIETAVAAAAKAGTRKDCQNAYAGIGILAIIPLLASAVVDTGCKWK